VRRFQQELQALSGGAWIVDVRYGVNKNNAFTETKEGKSHMAVGHSTYWSNTRPAATFFASVPFGMDSSEFAAWVSCGGGYELWKEHYDPHNLVPFPAGDTGTQMGGWFAKRMNSVNDFRGLRMRIEGLGGPILEKYGTIVVDAPASKLKGMLEQGELDACEFATPAMDEAAGLHKTTAKLIYHYPGWHQPSAVFEFLVNKNALASLSSQHQAVLRAAAHLANSHFTQSLLAKNRGVLDTMIAGGVELHEFPAALLSDLKKTSREVLIASCSKCEFSKKVMGSYLSFLDSAERWGPMSGAALWKWRRE